MCLGGETPEEQVNVWVVRVDALIEGFGQELVGPDVDVPTAGAGATLQLGKIDTPDFPRFD